MLTSAKSLEFGDKLVHYPKDKLDWQARETKKKEKRMDRVNINVSGVHFEFEKSILEGKETETLCKMCDDIKKSEAPPRELVVDRPVDCFAAILDYYQTGELHMPQTVCPKAFKRELSFWCVSPTVLEPCCLYRYYTFFDEFETREKFRAETFDVTNPANDNIPIRTENILSRLRRRIWNIIDFREQTLMSKIYLGVVFCTVLLCTITLALSTVKSLQRKVKMCEMLEYLEYSNHDDFEKTFEQFGSPDCNGASYNDHEDIEYHDFEHYDEYGETQQVTLPTITVRLFVFDVLEYMAAAFFTLDLLLRLFTCPSILNFFKSILNIFDILAVLSFYLQIIVLHVFMKHHKYKVSWVSAIGFLQLFRVIRLFRIVKNVRASRVLTFSLKTNAKDMVLLVLLMIIVVSFFGSLIYFIENGQGIESIPEAWYWTMITLTTVGYGDITPKTAGGRFVATLLSVCGVLLLSITLPMFVNNFLSLYQFSCMDETLAEHKRRQKGITKTFNAAFAVSHMNKNNTKTDTTELEDIDNLPIVVSPVLNDKTVGRIA